MGCDSSKSAQIDDYQHDGIKPDEFKITYRQFIANSRGEIFDLYHFSDLIHRSSSSVIRKVKHRVNKIQRVCKIMAVQSMKELTCLREVDIMKNFDHPNIVKLEEYFIEKHCLYLIFEKVHGQSLHQIFFNEKEISFADVLKIMNQIFSIISMMHSQNIAHRSIHPDHIMLQSRSQSGYLVKLIDFSSSTYCDLPRLKPPRTYQFQKAYTSQESETDPKKHDIYCCGLIFMSLLGGQQFLKNIRDHEQQSIRKLTTKTESLKPLQPLLMCILSKCPDQRPQACEILNHEIFSVKQVGQNSQSIKITLGNLRKYNIKDKLKSTLWMFATIKLQNFYNKVQLMNQFCFLDKNKDGKIQFQQLKDGLMGTFGISEQQAQAQTSHIFQLVDKNNSGQLDFSEFVMGAYLVGKSLSDDQLKILFNQIDTNKDGVITESQLQDTIQGLQQFELLAKMDNKLDFNGFKKIMKSYVARISQRHDN